MKYHVYCLLRKGEYRPFYIGATHDPHKREQTHRCRFHREKFSLVVLATLDTIEEASNLESELIIWYLGRGVALANEVTRPCYYGLPAGSKPYAPPPPPPKPFLGSPEISAIAAAYLAATKA